MTRHRLPLALVLVPALVSTAPAQTSYPMITRIEPTAVQRGKTAEVSFAGTGNTGGVGGNFEGASALLLQPPGLTGTVLGVESAARPNRPGRPPRPGGPRRTQATVKARLEVAADAPLGPREVRVATPQGASSVGLVVVVNDPVVTELDDAANDKAGGAQPLVLPCALNGTVGKAEDVDWYAVEAKAGQRLTFSVWANRLQNKIHDLQAHFDPILAVFDAEGRELATDDNHNFADPLLSHEFKADGTYYLQIRDTTYGGNANWTYVVQATAGPVATSVFPLAVNPGKSVELTAKGPNLDPSKPARLNVPADLSEGPRLVSFDTPNGPTLATPVVVTNRPVVVETGDTAEEFVKAQAVPLPAALCGTLAAPNDIDTFRFDAKKGTTYAFEAVARRAGAATDPVLRVINEKGATVTEADDTAGLGKDARIEWTAPADGTFAVQINDLHSRGGDEFGYVIEAGPASPDFTLTCDPDKVNVGPGGRVPLFAQVTRRGGFDGPVTVTPENLPPGVSASPLVIGPKMTQGVIVVSADADAKPSAALLGLKGKADTKAGPIERSVSPRQEIYLPGGGRGIYLVETLAAAVTAPSDITLEATPKTITLKPGGTVTIDVAVVRKAGFEQGVNLAVILQHLGGTHANPLPPGVTVREAGSKTLLGPTETKGKIVLQAAADAAPIDAVPVCVMGHVSINFVVKTAYASAPIAVSVGPK